MDQKSSLIKSPTKIQKIKDSWKYLTELLQILIQKAQPGINLLELEEFTQDWLDKKGLRGAFKGFQWYPANLCLSVNDAVVHSIPSDYILKEGDFLKIDMGIDYQWAISDSAVSVVVGGDEANPEAARLSKVTKQALDRGIDAIKPGKKFMAFSKQVYDYVSSEGFSVIKNLTGHSVGDSIHEPPHIFNFPHKSMNQYVFKPGMVLALEPIVAQKSDKVIEKPHINNWNLYTQHGDLGAHWEYTILITDNGVEILAGVN